MKPYLFLWNIKTLIYLSKRQEWEQGVKSITISSSITGHACPTGSRIRCQLVYILKNNVFCPSTSPVPFCIAPILRQSRCLSLTKNLDPDQESFWMTLWFVPASHLCQSLTQSISLRHYVPHTAQKTQTVHSFKELFIDNYLIIVFFLSSLQLQV